MRAEREMTEVANRGCRGCKAGTSMDGRRVCKHSPGRPSHDVDLPQDREEVGALRPVRHHFADDVERAQLLRSAGDLSQLLHPLVADVDDRVGLLQPLELKHVWFFGLGELEDGARFGRLVQPPVEEVEWMAWTRKLVASPVLPAVTLASPIEAAGITDSFNCSTLMT